MMDTITNCHLEIIYGIILPYSFQLELILGQYSMIQLRPSSTNLFATEFIYKNWIKIENIPTDLKTRSILDQIADTITV